MTSNLAIPRRWGTHLLYSWQSLFYFPSRSANILHNFPIHKLCSRATELKWNFTAAHKATSIPIEKLILLWLNIRYTHTNCDLLQPMANNTNSQCKSLLYSISTFLFELKHEHLRIQYITHTNAGIQWQSLR